MEMTNLIIVFILICGVGIIGLNVMSDLNTEKTSPTTGVLLNSQNMSFLSPEQVALIQSQNVSFYQGLNYQNSSDINQSGVAQNQNTTLTILNVPDPSSPTAFLGFIDVGFTAIMNVIQIPLRMLSMSTFFQQTFVFLGPIFTVLALMVTSLITFFIIKGILFYLMKVE